MLEECSKFYETRINLKVQIDSFEKYHTHLHSFNQMTMLKSNIWINEIHHDLSLMHL